MEDNIACKSLLFKQSFFWTADYLDVSAWIEHLPFAFWIIETLKPKVVVELGVHNGTSYFAFCQAVKNLNINTACYGVDTWRGDEHAGFYEEETFNKVAAYNSSKYSKFSTLIRSTFDEAKDYFIDGTIELLHIDGLHTYEAVKHDFETWLPKLAPNAIVVLHDINVRERNFGVFKFWDELKQAYPHFQFDFGHGLGIVAVGELVQEELNNLMNGDRFGDYYIFLRNLFSDRGHAFKTGFEMKQALKSEKEKAAIQEAAYSLLEEKNRMLELNNEQLRENGKIQEMQTGQLNITLANLKDAFVESNNKLEDAYAGLDVKYQSLVSSNEQLNESYIKLRQHTDSLEQKYKAAIDDISGRMQASLNQVSDELAQAKKNNEILQQSVQWYKATFVDRSVLGVLKEKLMKKH